MPDDASPAGPKLKQTLGFWQVALYGLGSMLGAGIYGLIGDAARGLGNAVWLAFGVAMVAALLTGLSYACVGSRHPRAGGAAYVTHRAFKQSWLAYVVGIAVMMSGLTSMATGTQLMAKTLAGMFGADPTTMEWTMKLVAIGIVALVGLVIFRGIRESMWVNILCTIVEASGLLFIIAVGVRFWGSVNYLEVPPAGAGEDPVMTLLILQGAVLTFFSFIGFEDLLNISEEVKDAPRNLPWGLITAMLIATAIYMAVAITAVSVVPWQELSSKGKIPLVEVARRAAEWFRGIDLIYAYITLFAVGNTALLNYIMGSRLLYGMSQQGLMPRVLGKVHPRRHTPYVAVLVLFVVVAVLILLGQAAQLAEATVLLLLVVFTTVNIALIRLKLNPAEPRGKFEVPVFVPALGALVCAVLIVIRVQSAFSGVSTAASRAPLIAGIIIAAGLGLFLVLKPQHVVLDEDEAA